MVSLWCYVNDNYGSSSRRHLRDIDGVKHALGCGTTNKSIRGVGITAHYLMDEYENMTTNRNVLLRRK